VGHGADLEEIRRVYERNFQAFVRAATAICGGTEAGRDAVQEAVVSAIRTRNQFRAEGTVEAWLWRAVVRTALKHRSRSITLVPLDTQPELTAPSDVPVEDLPAVRSLIADLPERQRLVLFLRYYGDLEYHQIADLLGIKTGTVSAALYAAHAALRAALEEVEHVRCS